MSDVVSVEVFASSRKSDTYLYVEAGSDLADLPEALQALLGTLRSVITIDLTPEISLARTTASEVLQQIAEEGYYLQLPPTLQSTTTGLTGHVDD